MTIDEAIAYAREKADKNSVCCDCTSIKDCKTCEQEHKYEQLAEWLEELKAIKSDGFTDNLLDMGFTKGYNKALDDCIKIAKAYRNTWDGIELAIRDIEELKAGVENERY